MPWNGRRRTRRQRFVSWTRCGVWHLPFPVIPIIRGDATSYHVAAASIVAKVTRDRQMAEYAKQYPQYGFDHNMGYGTAEHIDALRRFGPTPEHRHSFIRKFLEEGKE